MEDAGQYVVRRVVNPSATRSQLWREFAADVRALPPGQSLDASDVAGSCRSVDGAKSLAWRINHGRAAAFRPVGDYRATTEGTRVAVTYVGPRPATLRQEAS